MKKCFTLAFFFLYSISTCYSQEFQGIAVYKSQHKVDMKLDSTQIKNEMMKVIQEQLSKGFQKDYTLKFNQQESLYTENEKLNAPIVKNSGVTITVSSDQQIFYKNTAKKTYTKQQELMGKMFLIQDSLQLPDWKLEKESKIIGKYTCFKATWTREVTSHEYSSEEEGVKEVIKEISTTVWYTPEIPINNGPGNYWGLPGLILEVQEGNFNFLCIEITLNPQHKFEIEAPQKGKKVSQLEFNEIQEKKNKERIERYGGEGNVIMERRSGQ